MKANTLISTARLVSAIVILGCLSATSFSQARHQRNGKIAFTSDRDGNREIYVMNPDGTNQTRITHNNLHDEQPTWSPDGTKIAFVSERQSGGYAIFVMNGDGTNRTEVTSKQLNPDFSLSWTPNGKQIVFADEIAAPFGTDIFVVDIDGTDRKNITNDLGRNFGPSLSPNGTRIHFTSFRDGNPWLYSIKPDGGDFMALPIGIADGFGDIHVDWSPSGRQIAFVVNRWDFWTAIFIANADGTNRRLFDECNCNADRYSPEWSPDGLKLAFSVVNQFQTPTGWDLDSEIWVKNLDGTGLIRLTEQGRNSSPSWRQLIVNTTGDGDREEGK